MERYGQPSVINYTFSNLHFDTFDMCKYSWNHSYSLNILITRVSFCVPCLILPSCFSLYFSISGNHWFTFRHYNLVIEDIKLLFFCHFSFIQCNFEIHPSQVAMVNFLLMMSGIPLHGYTYNLLSNNLLMDIFMLWLLDYHK